EEHPVYRPPCRRNRARWSSLPRDAFAAVLATDEGDDLQDVVLGEGADFSPRRHPGARPEVERLEHPLVRAIAQMTPVPAGEIGAYQPGEIAPVAMGARVRPGELEPRGHGLGITVIRVLAGFLELFDGGGVFAFHLQKLGELVVTRVRRGRRLGNDNGEKEDDESEVSRPTTHGHGLT